MAWRTFSLGNSHHPKGVFDLFLQDTISTETWVELRGNIISIVIRPNSFARKVVHNRHLGKGYIGNIVQGFGKKARPRPQPAFGMGVF